MKQFKSIHDWKESMDTFFGDQFWKNFDGIFQSEFPPLNLYKSENELLCAFSIPGLRDIHDIHLFVHSKTLEIEGKLHTGFKGFNVMNQEIYSGDFKRVVDLPYHVREDRIEASYENGILLVQLYRLIPDEKERKPIPIEKKDDRKSL